MNAEEIKELREKIIKGLELTFEKLLKTKQENNGVFVFTKDDKIVFIKAREFNKQLTSEEDA